MLIFKARRHKNYALEPLTTLTQYFVVLPPNVEVQLNWSRFVNVRGFPGRNISADLHMEHMNRTVKTIIEGLGTNKTDNAITRAGKRDHLVTFWLHLKERQGWLQSMAKHAEKQN